MLNRDDGDFVAHMNTEQIHDCNFDEAEPGLTWIPFGRSTEGGGREHVFRRTISGTSISPHFLPIHFPFHTPRSALTLNTIHFSIQPL